MDPESSLERNESRGFARRVRKNLDFIILKRQEGEDVHEVAQLAVSLLGFIVFPWAAGDLDDLESVSLHDLEEQGWPHWDISLDEKGDTDTLRRLTEHLRNAAAHRRLRFSSDDPQMYAVQIEFEDAPLGKNKRVNWRATINSADLKEFCDRFSRRLE